MQKYYKDHYDVVIIGASLAGLASALTLLDNGYDVLVLEQHNLPGGVATSFVRNGIELEASLHEMLSIGSKECPLKIRKFLEEHNVFVDWVKVPIAYRYISNKLDVLVHTGENGDFSIPAKEIADACGDRTGTLYKEIVRFLKFCLKIHDEADQVSGKHLPKVEMLLKHRDFVKILGYSFKEVMDSFNLTDRAKELLSAYWMYLGSPVEDIPFLIYAYMLSDYLGYGAYIPRHTSHELSLKMLESVLNRGAQVEFCQKVDKILVTDKKVRGVKLASGVEIKCDYVISGAYPNVVYGKMIEPKNEVPLQAIKTVNAMDIGVSCFSLILILDKDYKELGIKDYATFFAPLGLDTKRAFDGGRGLNKWEYITSICSNVVSEDVTPPGTCFYSITYLPLGQSFKNMSIEEYEEFKKVNIDHFLEMESKRLGVKLKDHILEMVVETPITIAHYVGSYLGSIYGYRHTMDNSAQAREEMENKEQFISGLAFAGAHQISGDGMSPAITNGIKGARDIIDEDRRRKGDKK